MKYELAPFLKFSPRMHLKSTPIVGYLYLRVDRRTRDPHDPYANERDKWEYNKIELYYLNEAGKDYFNGSVDKYGNINTDRLKQAFETYDYRSTYNLAGGGEEVSNDYDYYDYDSEYGYDYGYDCYGDLGSLIINSGRIISPEYTCNLNDQNNLESMAYFMAQEDNFSQNSEVYWNKALQHIRELQLLSIKFLKDLKQQKLVETRRNLLIKELEKNGMTLRHDSKLCQKYINGETDKTVEQVTRTMAECKWVIEYHDLYKKMSEFTSMVGVGDDQAEFIFKDRKELFSILKEEILSSYPLPPKDKYPWLPKLTYAPFTIPAECLVFYSDQVPTEILCATAPDYIDDQSPIMLDLLEDIRQHGITYPLIIEATLNETDSPEGCEDQRLSMKVLLGNKRLFAADRVGIKNVKAIINVVPSTEAAESLVKDSVANLTRLHNSDDVTKVFGGLEAVDSNHLCFDHEKQLVLCVAQDHLKWTTSKAGTVPESWIGSW